MNAFPVCVDTTDAEHAIRDREGGCGDIRRDQSGRYRRAGVLRDRAAIDGGGGYTGLPR